MNTMRETPVVPFVPWLLAALPVVPAVTLLVRPGRAARRRLPAARRS